MKKAAFLLCLAALAILSCGPQERPLAAPVEVNGVPFLEMPFERLPDMNIPRMAHSLYYVNEEVTAIGGHTTGFIPTKTAEYFKGGKWHLAEPYYIHDDGFGLVLSNGKVMVGGGYAGDFGIGQSWGTELYDPATHSFSHLPILERKRTHATALELDGGRVLIAGNWYAPDQLEIYTPESGFQKEKEVSQARSFPYILRSGQDNVLIFAAWDNYGNELNPILIDRLEGESFTVPLLEQWRPVVPGDSGIRMNQFEVGNYSYLIPVMGEDGTLAAMLVSGEVFSLMELEQPIPTEGPWGPIQYNDNFYTDKEKGIAWLLGVDTHERLYLLELCYGAALRGGKAPVQVHYTQPVEGLKAGVQGNDRVENPIPMPEGLLLPDGRIFLAGGAGGHSYYDPTPVVCILSPGETFRRAGMPWWPFVLAAVLAVGAVLLLARKKPAPVAATDTPSAAPEDLMTRLTALMEKEEYFRRKDARLSDVAARLGTNTTYISAMVNGTTGTNFPSFLNGYRIRYAQQIMREHPDMPLHMVAEESGFPNETTFLRNFKAQTGLTPSEWKREN